MSEITKTENQRPKTKDQLICLFFALAVVAVYFFGLTIPLLGPDEPRYAEVAREMFQKNNFVTPTLGGFDWFEKPALLYWVQIVSYKIFGVSEFAARFGSAIFGLGTIFSLWILCKAVQSSKFKVQSSASENTHSALSTRHSALSYWLFLISASSIGLLTFSRAASFDIILTFPITASLVGFFIFDQSNKKSFTAYHLPLTIFYFFIGVALLAKGLVGIIFPFAIVAFYFVLVRKFPSKTFIFSLFWGMLLSLSVAAIWYVPMYQANGWKFIEEFFIQHHFARFASNKYQHPQPFWFFWLVLPLMTIPWLPFFLASIWDFIKVQSSKDFTRLRLSASPLLLFSLSWLLIPLIFFSFSGSKLPGYVLPALPAALVLTAEYVSRFAEKSKQRKMSVHLVAFITFAVVIIALQFLVVPYSQSETVKSLIETARASGYENEKVLNLNTISHSAEFYAAERLVRSDDGKQRKFYGAAEIAAGMKRESVESVLVLVPLEYLGELTASDSVEAKVLGDNTELAIVAVKSK